MWAAAGGAASNAPKSTAAIAHRARGAPRPPLKRTALADPNPPGLRRQAWRAAGLDHLLHLDVEATVRTLRLQRPLAVRTRLVATDDLVVALALALAEDLDLLGATALLVGLELALE